MKKLIEKIKQKYQNWKHKKLVKKRLEEIKKRDPFIYD
jgi:hypothetical protein|tara:strand:- start:37 stop:150 length:114 start_codon:yes stop_codon:yes gene_type:complete